ncbi:glycosyltransferase family 4 protein [Noviherbaspirillum galbum]|uniref:Glycosyltransferase family 4 protein n=1 Tax=Noviherbaspirillum galbum TaxID=2709383 RepID=A0A6B3SUK7_9BURK|nr:glycosyltransferase family 1 protein [Noviherbaspirillum galbum]NEX64483.1 glycosyltransferase family 4 protein [Noviherbaspirillum galbum]
MRRILLDLTQLPLERTGVGIYAVNYVHCLQSLAEHGEMHFLVLDDDKELLASARAVPGASVIALNARLFRRFAFRVLLEQVLIPMIAISRRMDAVHSLHYSFPLLSFGRFRRIVTVCDMSFFLFPELHVPVKRVFFQFFIRRLARADGLLFISESTQRDFEARFPRPGPRKAVIHLGADLRRLAQAPDPAVLDALRRKFDLDDYVLYVGTVEPRKNLIGLIQAFEQVAERHPGLKLVIAGKLGWDYDDVLDAAKRSPVRDRIVMTGYLSETEKHALIKAARLFVYVSFYEGFGLPVLEGMAAGVATITSNLSSMPEVAGDAAPTVDPREPAQIAAAMERLLSDDGERQDVASRGLAQSRRFTWENLTHRSLGFYRQVIAARR